MLPPIRRVVTGHTTSGRATVVIDEMMPLALIPSGAAYFAKPWTTATSPADNNDPFDGSKRETGLVSPGGSVLRIVDIPPAQRSPMHRTLSLDYGLVLSGQVDMELDDGVITHLKSGDVVVQRGTSHAWINNSADWCRMVFVLIEASPVMKDGRSLPAA